MPYRATTLSSTLAIGAGNGQDDLALVTAKNGRQRPSWRLPWPIDAPARERCIRRPDFSHVGAATDGAKTPRPRRNPRRDANYPVVGGRHMAKVELSL